MKNIKIGTGMLFAHVLFALSCLLTTQNGFATTAEFDSQREASAKVLLTNSSLPNTQTGIIVASPSTSHPNYFYHWIRDAGISFLQIQQVYLDPNVLGAVDGVKDRIRLFMHYHMNLNLNFQHMQNLLAGLGEPKFNVDGSAFQQPWGRPQNDGPALRAISFMNLANIIVQEGWADRDILLHAMYDSSLQARSLVKDDLEFVAHHWQDTSFDLWEEVQGKHFFTLMVQRRAMKMGATFAEMFGDSGAAAFYDQQASAIEDSLKAFWNASANRIDATHQNLLDFDNFALFSKTSNIDMGVLLGSLLGDTDDGFFAPYEEHILATYMQLKNAFGKIYVVNQNRPADLGVAIGRYPEDTYDGYTTSSQGNPWFIGSQTMAEICYKVVAHARAAGVYMVTQASLPFYQDAVAGTGLQLFAGQTVRSSDPNFAKLSQAIMAAGDAELNITLVHKDADGSLSEQINRNDGIMQGAVNLTWSHASYLSAVYARDQVSNTLFAKAKGHK